MGDRGNPLQQAAAGFGSVVSSLSSNWGGLGQQLRREAGRAAAGAQLIPGHLRRHQQLLGSNAWAPALAVSSGGDDVCQ